MDLSQRTRRLSAPLALTRLQLMAQSFFAPAMRFFSAESPKSLARTSFCKTSITSSRFVNSSWDCPSCFAFCAAAKPRSTPEELQLQQANRAKAGMSASAEWSMRDFCVDLIAFFQASKFSKPSTRANLPAIGRKCSNSYFKASTSTPVARANFSRQFARSPLFN